MYQSVYLTPQLSHNNGLEDQHLPIKDNQWYLTILRSNDLKNALKILAANKLNITERTKNDQGLYVKAVIPKKNKETVVSILDSKFPPKPRAQDFFDMELNFDKDGRAIKMNCSCIEFKKTSLKKGPCSHLIALMKKAESNTEVNI